MNPSGRKEWMIRDLLSESTNTAAVIRIFTIGERRPWRSPWEQIILEYGPRSSLLIPIMTVFIEHFALILFSVIIGGSDVQTAQVLCLMLTSKLILILPQSRHLVIDLPIKHLAIGLSDQELERDHYAVE